MDKEKLIELIELGFTQNEIGKHINKSQTTVGYWLRKYDLKTKNFRIGDPKFYESESFKNKKHKIVSMYNEKLIAEIQNCYDNELKSWREVAKIFSIGEATLYKWCKLGILKSRSNEAGIKLAVKQGKFSHKKSEESKDKIRQSRLKQLTENPDNPSWKSLNKKYSIPCEKVKEFLKSQNIDFIEEFRPLLHLNRFFSLDIAFIDKKVAIEINGNQHYDTNGDLKPYYQNRHDLIESEGWIIHEVKYNKAFDLDYILSLVPV